MTVGNMDEKKLEKEDLKNAVNIHAGIASQLMAASLALIGVLLGYFDLKHLALKSVWGFLIIIAVFCLLASFIICGIGLKKIRNDGINGEWDLKLQNNHWYFRLQTWLNFLAIFFFFIVFLFHPNIKSDELIQMEKTNTLIENRITLDSLNIRKSNENDKKIDSLRNYIRNSIT